MKRFFTAFFNIFIDFSQFQSYRKHKRGIWYKVYDEYGQSGVASPIQYWTQERPEKNSGIIVVKTESYS